jgi:hypothetical protein
MVVVVRIDILRRYEVSDWTMKPRNEIENKLHAEGYRVKQESNCNYVATSPDGKLLQISRVSVDDCWTACHQHSEAKQDGKFVTQLTILAGEADKQYKKEHEIWLENQNTGDGYVPFPDIAFTRKNTLHEIISMYELYRTGKW